jgi:hypothetical protein
MTLQMFVPCNSERQARRLAKELNGPYEKGHGFNEEAKDLQASSEAPRCVVQTRYWKEGDDHGVYVTIHTSARGVHVSF